MAANVNSYIAAGNAAVKNTFASLAAARDNSPKYDEIAKAGMKSRAEQKVTAMQADADVKRAQTEANAYLERNEITLDANKKINKSKKKIQFAGKIAAAGAVMAASLLPAAEIIKPRARDFSGQEARLKGQMDKLNRDIQDMKNKPPAPAVTDPSSTTSSTTGFNPQSGPGWQRLSNVIRFAEGTTGDAGYTTMFGHRQFTDMSRHPNNPMATSWGTQSEAAGAYQFMLPTWNRAQKALNLPDFSRESQEKAGRYLTQGRGVDPDATFSTKEEFTAAMDKLAPEWAGLPYQGISPQGYGRGSSYYGQGGKSVDQLWEIYNQ